MAENDPQTIAQEARDEFDLGAFLGGNRKNRVRSVTLYTDEEAGEELGGHEEYEEQTLFGVPQKRIRTWGLTGKIVDLSRTEELEAANGDEIAELKARVATLAEQVANTAIVVNLKSVPPIVKKDAKRAARKEVGIHGKLSQDDPRYEDYLDELNAQTLARVVDSWTLRANDTTYPSMSAKQARALQNFVPEREYNRLIREVDVLTYESVISEKAVEDADF